MILAEVVAWWYSTGWVGLIHRSSGRIALILEFFSVELLFKTLFDPFRQIDAGRVRGSLQEEWRAFGNRTFSRVIGAVIRMFVIFTGLLVAGVMTVVGLVQLLAWPLVPLLPGIGLVLALTGRLL